MSPRPMRSSAPGASRIVRESIWDAIANAIRLGKLALMRPVTTLTDGRWVARTRWIPVARAFWASRTIGSSTVWPLRIIRSASSSTMITMYGSRSAGSARVSLYEAMFLAVAPANFRYRISISPTAHFSAAIARSASVMTGTRRWGIPL